MDEETQNKTKATTESSAEKPVEVSTNPELGIKRIRTFADDLAEARAKAGEPEDPVKEKKKSIFFAKKEPIKEPSFVPQKPRYSNAEQEEDVTTPQATTLQPSREYIKSELAKSGIVTEEIADEEMLEIQVQKTSTPAIRTYKNDAAESIEKNDFSRVSIVAAEQDRRAREKDFSGSSTQSNDFSGAVRNLGLGALSILLIVSGVWAVLHFYTGGKIDDAPALQTNVGIILSTNSTSETNIHDVEGKDLMTFLLALEKDAPSEKTGLSQVNLLENTLFGEQKINAEDFLLQIGGVPSSLARSVEDDFIFGFHGGTSPSPYLILKTKDFDTTFRGVLDWESTISRDLSPLFGNGLSGVSFEDILIKNKDTRMLRDDQGKTVLLYAFPNADTVVITTNEDTFLEVFARMSASNKVRN